MPLERTRIQSSSLVTFTPISSSFARQRFHVRGNRAADHDVAAGRRRSDHQRARFDLIRNDRVIRAVQMPVRRECGSRPCPRP